VDDCATRKLSASMDDYDNGETQACACIVS
jgi:hypothetical protein